MKFALLTVAAMIAGAAAAPLTEEQYQFLFTKFSQQFNKSYEVGAVFSKYQTFKNNIDLIVAHNARGESFTMGVNQFTDMTQQEFSQFMGLKAIPYTEPKVQTSPCPAAAAMAKANRATKDWREEINPVKDQAQCGSCWAFATMGSLEPQIKLATGKLYDLSEQQLVDCDTGSSGCNGGLMTLGLDYIKDVAKGKVALTKDYPYTARDGKCNKDIVAGGIDSGLTGYKVLDGSISRVSAEEDLIQAVQDGTVSIALAASSSAFQFYKDGIVSTCTDKSVNHGVTIAAYYADDSEGVGGDNYYVVRNSWGASWGDKGYIRLAADKNSCGLVTRAAWNVQPTVKK